MQIDFDLIVIGAGIFGSFAAKAAERKGLNVLVMDAKFADSGSKAAGCVIRPSWIESLGSEVVDPAMSFLFQNYRVKNVLFNVPKSENEVKQVPAYVLEPSQILCQNAQPLRAVQIGDGYVEATEVPKFNENSKESLVPKRYTGKVLVAAGVWSSHISGIEIPPIQALCGSSYIFRGTYEPTIKPYAPYKQMVYFPSPTEEGKTWFGDGTAILKKNYKINLDHKTLERAEREGLNKPLKMNFGMRPYIDIPEQPGCLLRLSENLWVSTGGAKNGCLLGAYQAVKFAEVL